MRGLPASSACRSLTAQSGVVCAGRTVLQVLEDFPSAQVPLHWLLQAVPRLQPRYFSIASSLRAHPGQVHILAALVDYHTPHRQHKRGVCSAWLADLQAGSLEAKVRTSAGLLLWRYMSVIVHDP